MNSQGVALRVAGVIFGLICVGHIWRLIAHVDVRVGTQDLPVWLSVLAAVIAGGMSIWFLRLSKR